MWPTRPCKRGLLSWQPEESRQGFRVRVGAARIMDIDAGNARPAHYGMPHPDASPDLKTHSPGALSKNFPSFAVARNCGIGSSSLNADVNAFDRLHIVRCWNSSY
jgi:hypothetical protein